jgi:hypothetical protein
VLLSLGLKSNIEVPEYLKSPPIDGNTVPPGCDVPIAGIVALPNTGGGMSPAISIAGLGSMEVCSESNCMLYTDIPIGVLIGGIGWDCCGMYWGCGCCTSLDIWFAG